MAAVLSCGPRAALSHHSAAALWGIAPPPDDVIEVSVPVTSRPRRPGVRIFRRPALTEDELTVQDGIPVTGIVRTLMDVALGLDRPDLERAINEADKLDLIDFESLTRALDAYRGCPGVGRLRAILGPRDFRLTDSELERRFLRLVHGIGLRLPLTGQWLNGFKADFFWPELKLVVETDGLRYHRTPAQQARDRARDQAFTAAGLTPLRFTHAQIQFERDRVGKVLLTVARRLEGGRQETTSPA
jgi:very-short-patch-repair endonuclease